MIPAAAAVQTPAQYGAVAPSGADWPVNRRDYTKYRVNRIYPTVQGEGSLCGTPMSVVRLQGCPVGCVFCFGVKAGKHQPRVHLARPRGGRGRLAIQEARRGDVLLTFNEQHGLVETVVSQVHSRRVEEWYDIKIEGKTYFVTAEHPFATTARGWVEAQELQPGDMIYHAQPRELVSYYKLGERNPNWEPGAKHHAPNYRALKAKNRRDQRPCEWCGGLDWLEVHHLDEDRDNDKPKNLASICHPCHSRHHQRGYNFWNGERVDGKRSEAEAMHNGATVESIEHVVRGAGWARSKGGGYVGDLPVYNLTCKPFNSFLLDYMWVHNCDTPESWDPDFKDKGAGLEGSLSADHMTACQVADAVAGHPPRWALVTGGEPLWHDCGALTSMLRRRGIKTALETSGVYPVSGTWDWVCVSPKPAGRLPINKYSLAEANEVKWLVGRERDVVAFEVFLSKYQDSLRLEQDLRPRDARRTISLTIQPVSCSPKATELCLRALMDHPEWRLSVQMHKVLGVA